MTYGRRVQLQKEKQLSPEEIKFWPGVSEVEYDEKIKAKLPSGPWKEEPDKIVWRYKDMDCMIVRNECGNLCGYVGVPKGHPYFGAEYETLDVQVHGGLTFGAPCNHGGKVCHKSDEEVFWFGFDCAHFGDLMPRWDFELGRQGLNGERFKDSSYKDLQYVKQEVESLAVQLKVIK